MFAAIERRAMFAIRCWAMDEQQKEYPMTFLGKAGLGKKIIHTGTEETDKFYAAVELYKDGTPAFGFACRDVPPDNTICGGEYDSADEAKNAAEVLYDLLNRGVQARRAAEFKYLHSQRVTKGQDYDPYSKD